MTVKVLGCWTCGERDPRREPVPVHLSWGRIDLQEIREPWWAENPPTRRSYSYSYLAFSLCQTRLVDFALFAYASRLPGRIRSEMSHKR